MPIFKYNGFKADGTSVSGAVEASGISDAAAKIKAQGVLPEEIAEPRAGRSRGLFQRIDETFIPNLTRQLSILLSSGVSLIDALQSLSAEHKGSAREMLITIRESVAGGSGFYRSLEDFGDYFPDFYVTMVQAGEQSGTLDRVLVRLADFLEKQNEIRSKVRSAMIYPVFMTGISFVVLSFLFTFVIPKIVRIFKDAQSALPFMTVVLMAISNFFAAYWWAVAGVFIMVALIIRKYQKRNRLFIDGILLKLPGNVFQSLYCSRFARTLGFLVEGGLPMLRALSLSARSMGNKVLEASILKAESRVAEGRRLSASIENFPPVFLQLIATGEKSGRLAETLYRAADAYENEFNRKVQKAVSIFEPALIILMGVVVAFIVMAVLLPMLQLSQLVK